MGKLGSSKPGFTEFFPTFRSFRTTRLSLCLFSVGVCEIVASLILAHNSSRLRALVAIAGVLVTLRMILFPAEYFLLWSEAVIRNRLTNYARSSASQIEIDKARKHLEARLVLQVFHKGLGVLFSGSIAAFGMACIYLAIWKLH